MQRNIPLLSLLIALVIALGFAVLPVSAQDAAKLLERGIYTEETVGNLGRAIEIYETIADDATARRGHAAEALYRIGMCRLKQDDLSAATKAFERVLQEYPEQERFVRLVRDNMPDDAEDFEFMPAPWLDGEVQRLTLKVGSGLEIGTLILTVDPTEVDGVEAWRFRSRRRIFSDSDSQAITEVLARRDDQAPISGSFYHSLLGRYDAIYSPKSVHITTVDSGTVREEGFSGRAFDNEQGFHLFRLLPLEIGFKSKIEFITTVAGPAKEVGVEIPDIETVAVPAGEFECFRVVFRFESKTLQTFWFSTDPSHHLVKLEASGIVGELAEVYQRNPETGLVHTDDEGGFSMAMPPGWLHTPFNDGTAKVILLDPEAEIRSVVRLHPVQDPCSAHGAAMRRVDSFRGLYKDFEVHDGSWQEREINDRPAVSFMADFREGEKTFIGYWTYIESGPYCVEFDFKVPTAEMEGLREDLDAIIASYDGPRTPVAQPAVEKPGQASAADVRAVVTAFHRAASHADYGRYVEHLSPDLRFLGTDRTERFDFEGLTAIAENAFSKGVGWVAEPVEQNVFVSESGTIAWFDEQLESENFGEMRVTGVLRLEDGQWRIVQYNVGFPVPNTLVPDLITKIGEVDATVHTRPTSFADAPPLDADDPVYDVKAALRDFHVAASHADADRFFSRLAPDVVYFGTDRAERWSLEALTAFVNPYLKAGTGWTSVPFEQHVSLSADGQIAWFEQSLGREKIGELRSTGVMRKDDGQWRIVHYNLTLPVPNEIAPDLAVEIRGFYSPG